MKRTTITLAAVAGAALALATGAGAATLPGAALFAKSGCAACHTLKAAKAKGQVGPNLDKLKPSVARSSSRSRTAAAACRRTRRR